MKLSFRPLRSSVFLALAITGVRPASRAEPMFQDRPLREVAEAKIEAPASTFWAGEVFRFSQQTRIATRHFSLVAPEFEWTPPGIVIDEWSATARTSNAGFEVLTRTANAYVRGVGTVALPGTTQTVKLITGYAGDRSPLTDSFSLAVTAPKLTVKPLPSPAPSGFAKAVGEFALHSSLSTLQAKVGESVTWTVELSGTGNWPEISRLPGRVISKDFTAVAPVVKRTTKPGTLFEGSLREDVLLVATKPGEYQLGPVRYTFFNPQAGIYQMVTSETFTLAVAAPGGISTADTSADRYRPVNTARTPIPASPQPLPLDPLAGGWGGMKPLNAAVRTGGVIIAISGFLLYWLWLAARRSHATDPLQPRRAARDDLHRILRDLDRPGLSPAEVREGIFAWQSAVIRFAGLTLATPSAGQISHAVEGRRRGTTGSSWAPLWREANGALYSERGGLPHDWVMRAKAALSEQTLQPVPWRARFLRRNLFPFASLASVTLALTPPAARGDALDEYRKGDFNAAEAEWRAALAARPLNAPAHYNLALVAAQQDRWPESLAHALAAFCLKPADPAIRWQLALSVDRAGIDHPVLSAFVHGTGRYQVARQFSAGQWGVLLIGAALATSVGSGAFLFGLYHRRSRRFRWTAAAAMIAAAVLVVTSSLSLRCYGPLADDSIGIVARNTLLCSVPTEIDTTQKTVPLPAGSLAKVDRTFLGWSRLVFPNQQTGWVRSDAFVPLYR